MRTSCSCSLRYGETCRRWDANGIVFVHRCVTTLSTAFRFFFLLYLENTNQPISSVGTTTEFRYDRIGLGLVAKHESNVGARVLMA